MVFLVMGLRIAKIGENSSCNVSQALSIVSQIRWCVKALKKVPLSSDLKKIMVQLLSGVLPDE